MHFACDSDCTKPAQWRGVVLPFGAPETASQRGIGLAFDAQNATHVGYRTWLSTSHARCDANCDLNANWVVKELLSADSLNSSIPWANPCTQGTWAFESGFGTGVTPQGTLVSNQDIVSYGSGGVCTESHAFEYQSLLVMAP